MTTVRRSKLLEPFENDHSLRYRPLSVGAVIRAFISIVSPGSVLDTSMTLAPISSPEESTSVTFSHMQVPTLRTLHVFVNISPGSRRVPSGMVTSATYWAFQQLAGSGVSAGIGLGVQLVHLSVNESLV